MEWSLRCAGWRSCRPRQAERIPTLTVRGRPQPGPQQLAPATAKVRRRDLVSNGVARWPGGRCRTEKRKVGGSRPPLTTLVTCGYRRL
jgi:hypothetical protein